ncbi:MBL fold metallo-hydrolase [Marinicella sp. W31]|uniref:MBL fold metallo-hydrolase n=1 Tax=Marinicella sp. W31 TaxID=3023713 RepID=UPI003757C973
MKQLLIVTLVLLQSVFSLSAEEKKGVHLMVLGIAQDAGYPQINCYRPHCMRVWENPQLRRTATALGLVDFDHRKKYLFEATPNMPEQLYRFHSYAADTFYPLSGVFLTHAHMGHYSGLMFFGRESASTDKLPVFAMPKMQAFLSSNGPWSQLVALENIKLSPLQAEQAQILNHQLRVKPFVVPHRDEFSETVGFEITGPNKTALFIPDIDKWSLWKRSIVDEIKRVDYAFVDATFFQNGELPNRDMSEVPHPFVQESMEVMKHLSKQDKAKVIFIHMNHTNPLLIENSTAQQLVKKQGFQIAYPGMVVVL